MSLLFSLAGWKAILNVPGAVIAFWLGLKAVKTERGRRRWIRVGGWASAFAASMAGVALEVMKPGPKDVWVINEEQAEVIRHELSWVSRSESSPMLVNIVADNADPPGPETLGNALANVINGMTNYHAIVSKQSRVPPMVGIHVELADGASKDERSGANALAEALFKIGLTKSRDTVGTPAGQRNGSGGREYPDAKMTLAIAPNP